MLWNCCKCRIYKIQLFKGTLFIGLLLNKKTEVSKITLKQSYQKFSNFKLKKKVIKNLKYGVLFKGVSLIVSLK